MPLWFGGFELDEERFELRQGETLLNVQPRVLETILYAGAAISHDIWERLENLSVRVTGKRVPMVSSWGATETAPIATAISIPRCRAGRRCS